MLLIVTSGIGRLDDRKVKDVWGGKGRMLDREEVLAVTGHCVGSVCPVRLLSPLPVYCDISLRCFKEVVPAAGSGNAALEQPRKGSPSWGVQSGWMSAGNRGIAPCRCTSTSK